MQDLERNMEDLFRKAAARYPLKTSTDDWDKIAPLLAGSPILAGKENKNRRVKKYGLLFIPFFLLLSGNVNVSTKHFKSGFESVKDISAIVPATLTLEKMEDKISFNLPVGQKVNPISHWMKTAAERRKVISGDTGRHKEDNKVIYQSSTGAGNLSNENTATTMIGETAKPADSLPGNHDTSVHANAVKIAPTAISDTTSGTLNGANYPVRKVGRLYWGLVTGISFNQVKSQGLRKPGYDFGALMGYTVTNRFSIEAGLIYEKKFYFTSGDYFKMTNASASMPQGMKIISLEGSCSIFEVPLMVKYSLLNKPNRRFYVSAGASAYIITNEYNKYNTVINGTRQSITAKYNKTSPYAAAVFDASIGYERSVSRSAQIRIEPYVQIPLKGIGIGSLQVMTTGLHIGYTRTKR